jgi:hypothetical protein
MTSFFCIKKTNKIVSALIRHPSSVRDGRIPSQNQFNENRPTAFTSQIGMRTKKSSIRCWIYNGDNGPEMYLLDEHGRLKDRPNGRRVKPKTITQPVLISTSARTQTLPDSPSPAFSPIGDAVPSPLKGESNDTESGDSAAVSDWPSGLTWNELFSNVGWPPESPDLSHDFDRDFGLS